MKQWLRISFLVGVLAVVGMQVPAVYTDTRPMIDKLQIRSDKLVGIVGHGLPGDRFDVFYRQRSFKQGRRGSLEDPFEWCEWVYQGIPVWLGQAVVGENGKWRLGYLDVIVYPAVVGGDRCGGGLRTDFLLGSSSQVPEVRWFRLKKQGSGKQTGRVEGRIRYADRVAIGIADGPNDDEDGRFDEFEVDVRESGVDLCGTPGYRCGQAVSWEVTGGTFVAPSIAVYDGTSLAQRDPEFVSVQGMLEGHKPGGSVLAIAKVDRPNPGFAVKVNVNIKGLEKLSICDGLGFFDFLEGLIPQPEL